MIILNSIMFELSILIDLDSQLLETQKVLTIFQNKIVILLLPNLY